MAAGVVRREQGERARTTPRVPSWLPWIALALLLVVGGALALYIGRSTSFYYDEWDFVELRRAWDANALLTPHNEHLSLVPVLIYKFLFSTVGIEAYTPYRMAGTLVHLLVVALLFVYARRRVGDLLALAAATVVMFLGPAWPDVLWPFQMGFLGSLAAGLGALLALDRHDRRGDLAAALLLSVALASSSLGIPLFLVAALELLGGPDRRARWPVLAVPAVLYGMWWLGYHSNRSTVTVDNLLSTPGYVADAASGAVGALFGLSIDWGRPLTVALVALLVVVLGRRATIPWRLAALIALPLAFWALTALARADLHEPVAPRYLYPGVVFLLLIAVEAARGVRVSGRATAALLALLAFVTVANVGALRNGGGWLRDRTAELNGALAAMTLAGPKHAPAAFAPEPTVAPTVRAGLYFAAVEDLGSPAPAPSALPRLFQRGRATADATLTRAYGLALAAPQGAPSGAAPAIETAQAVGTHARGACVRARPQAAGSTLDLTVPSGGVLVASDGGDAKVFLRRFSDLFGEAPIGEVAAGGRPGALQIPADASTAPWHARIALTGPVRVCRLGA